MLDVDFFINAFVRLLAGLPLTLNLATVSILLGAALGIVIYGISSLPFPPARWFAAAYVTAFRGTPLLVQIFLIYFGLAQFRHEIEAIGLWHILREPYWCAMIALSMNTAAYCAEIVRGGILAVPAGAIEAAAACGMSKITMYHRIIAPIALRSALPAYGNEIILMIKATSLASTITLLEITGLAHRLIAESFRAIEVFGAAGIIYLLVNFLAAQAVTAWERWLSTDRRRHLPHKKSTVSR